MKNKELFVSIIIPTRNRPEQLQRCLAAITKVDYPKDRFEVIVVDDGSSFRLDPTVDLFSDKINLRLFKQKSSGPAAARNNGAQQAKGEFLVFTDDDCMASPCWLSVLSNFLGMNPDAIVGGKIVNGLATNIFASASQVLISYLYSYYNKNSDKAYFFTSNNFALSKKRFLTVGGFDHKWGRAAGEDREFCDRWLLNGYQMVFAAEAKVYHMHEMSLPQFLGQHFNYGRGAYYFHRARERRNQDRFRIEPLSFYLNLLRFPFLRFKKLKAAAISGLLVLAQAANVLGYLAERSSQKSENKLAREIALGPELQNTPKM